MRAEPASGSVAFDPVKSDYDRTRALPPRAQASVVKLLGRELRGRGTALEIGVGTGRIALPLASAGQPLVGVDLSLPMLERLRENAGGRAPFPVTIADATRLPFGPGTFGGAYAVHVLHLIPAWRTALAELVRVVRPGGACSWTWEAARRGSAGRSGGSWRPGWAPRRSRTWASTGVGNASMT